MLTAKEFSEAVLGELRKAGWNLRGKTAWIRGADGDVVVDLQKSNYDQEVFVNIGVALHRLGHSEPPKYNECHLQVRVECLLDGFPDINTDGIEELRRVVCSMESALRVLGELRELRSRAAAGKLAGGLVRKEARELLAESPN